MNIFLPIIFNLIVAFVLFITPDWKKPLKVIAPILAFANIVIGVYLLFNPNIPEKYTAWILWDNLTKLVFFFIGFFGLVLSIYSAGFIKKKLNKYFSYFFLTLASAYGIILSANWIVLIIFWGISGITLYLMMQFNSDANLAAKKTLIILGGSDSLLILGVAVLYRLTGSFGILSSTWSMIAFICIATAAFAKAGNMPFHTWIPDCADKAPPPVTAFMPASLDKLLGIYLLARIFSIITIPPVVKISVMLIGSITIICAVFMALTQHTAKKLLSYHAISQVGYMVLGIGTGNPLGIAGGLFHMINNSIYKSCLFLGTGQVEKVSKTDHLDKLGGLAKYLPITFTSMLIASFAISGLPPLNGFFSKWLIYQGVLAATAEQYPFLSILCLLAALFGSALTLASFMKLMHALFLGAKKYPEGTEKKFKEKFSLVFPQIILALSCIVLGVFAFDLFIKPMYGNLDLTGLWHPKMAMLLIVVGLVLGALIFLISRIKIRRVKGFAGGEGLRPDMHISGADFYEGIENGQPFKFIYGLAEKKLFDLYEVLKAIAFYVIKLLRHLHNGVLTNYLSWILAGGVVILVVIWFM